MKDESIHKYQAMGDRVHERQHFSHQSHDVDLLAAVLSPDTFSVLSG